MQRAQHQGDLSKIACSYKSLPTSVKPGQVILAADGNIMMEVVECKETYVPRRGQARCGVGPPPRHVHAHVTLACPAPLCSSVVVKCLNSEKLGQRKNMNLPGVIVDLPTVTKKDTDDLENFGATRGVDFIAASFVRKGTDIGTPCAAQRCAWPTLCRQC